MHEAPAQQVLPISARDLCLYRGSKPVIDRVSVTIGDPEIAVLLGPNGAGKSLLVRMLAGLVQPDRGDVAWAGRAPERACAFRLGVVFHHPVMLNRSALANVRFALRAAGVPRHLRNGLAMEALVMAGLEAMAKVPARFLSGGEQQRLALVRAMATRPEALLLDEATANLDPGSTLAIENLVRRARQHGTPVLLVTHDLSQARRLADRILFLHGGVLEADSRAEHFFTNPPTKRASAFVEGRLVL